MSSDVMSYVISGLLRNVATLLENKRSTSTATRGATDSLKRLIPVAYGASVVSRLMNVGDGVTSPGLCQLQQWGRTRRQVMDPLMTMIPRIGHRTITRSRKAANNLDSPSPRKASTNRPGMPVLAFKLATVDPDAPFSFEMQSHCTFSKAR